LNQFGFPVNTPTSYASPRWPATPATPLVPVIEDPIPMDWESREIEDPIPMDWESTVIEDPVPMDWEPTEIDDPMYWKYRETVDSTDWESSDDEVNLLIPCFEDETEEEIDDPMDWESSDEEVNLLVPFFEALSISKDDVTPAEMDLLVTSFQGFSLALAVLLTPVLRFLTVQASYDNPQHLVRQYSVY
jgi:hypothetical protein